MESILYQIISEKLNLDDLCYQEMRTMPQYLTANARYQYACKQMDGLEKPERELFLEYEGASNAMSALQETAAFMAGFRVCLNLLTETFR